jgi:glycosyltransferase involved in cell wall biosynthesis
MCSRIMAEPHICLVAPQVFPVLTGDRTLQLIGGAEVQQSFIARGLNAAGYPVTIISNDYGQSDNMDFEGMRVLKMRQQKTTIPVIRYFHPRLTGMWSAMQRADADIYYQRCAGANTFVTGLYARTHGKRFVYAAAHDLDLNYPRTRELFQGRGGWRDFQLYRMGLRMADVVIAQHVGQIEEFRRCWQREAEWIPSGYVPLGTASCDAEGVVLWVSTIRRWKRAELFLELAQALPAIRFRMIGGVSRAEGDSAANDLFSKIESFAERLPNVEFLGFLPYADVEQHFNQARLLINTSDYEGFPNTFLQAWARGIPTISFVNCGARDSRGPIGVIATEFKEMQGATVRLIADRDAWAEESARCLRYFEANHSLAAVIARYRALFDRLAVPA